jgi:hypothetical protein
VTAARRRGRTANGSVPDRAELEGYLTGIDWTLANAPDTPTTGSARRERDHARHALSEGELRRAEEHLRRAEELLEENAEEVELIERPRGLIGYVPHGSAGRAPSAEEDPLANRLRLVERLWTLRRSQGRPVERWLEDLNAAATALRAGDRLEARRRIDRVHAALADDRPAATERAPDAA